MIRFFNVSHRALTVLGLVGLALFTGYEALLWRMQAVYESERKGR